MNNDTNGIVVSRGGLGIIFIQSKAPLSKIDTLRNLKYHLNFYLKL